MQPLRRKKNSELSENAASCEHLWQEATCTKPRMCIVCGEREGSALGHDWQAATCTKPQTCSVCASTRGRAKDHDWQDATCAEPQTCALCGLTEGEPAEHYFADVYCIYCGEKAACDHDWQPKTLKDATCNTAGQKQQVCTLCGEQGETSSIPAKGHSWKDATCESPKTCKRCGATSGSALGHDWKDATCETPKTCRRCGKTEGGTVRHSFGEWYEDRPASCEYQQRLAHMCKVCGKVEVKAGTPALGHDYNWFGVCKRCGKYFDNGSSGSNDSGSSYGSSPTGDNAP